MGDPLPPHPPKVNKMMTQKFILVKWMEIFQLLQPLRKMNTKIKARKSTFLSILGTDPQQSVWKDPPTHGGPSKEAKKQYRL